MNVKPSPGSYANICRKRFITSRKTILSTAHSALWPLEIIREKLMRFPCAELPYSVTVEIERFQTNERAVMILTGLILVENVKVRRDGDWQQRRKIKLSGLKRVKTYRICLKRQYT